MADALKPGEAPGMNQVSRRHFIRAVGGVTGGAVALPWLMAARGGSASAPSGSPGSGSASANGSPPSKLFPTYIPTKNGPKPDYPSTGPQYEDGFDNYPASQFKAITEAPGKGSTVNISTIALFPPPTPYAANPAWQAVNKAMNATVKFNIFGGADYATKMATTMAGGDLPDMMFFWASPSATSAIGAVNGGPSVCLQRRRRPYALPGRRRRQGLSRISLPFQPRPGLIRAPPIRTNC